MVIRPEPCSGEQFVKNRDALSTEVLAVLSVQNTAGLCG